MAYQNLLADLYVEGDLTIGLELLVEALQSDGAAGTSGNYHGVQIPGPDYAKRVDAFHGYGERVEDPAKLEQAPNNGLAAVSEGKVVLVDVVLSI